MNIRTYAYGGIAIIAALCGVLAFTFLRLGFVGVGPLVMAILIFAAALTGFIVSLPKDKPKKAKKVKKAKQQDISAEDTAGEDA